MVQNQKFRCRTSAGRSVPAQPVAGAVDDVVEPVEQHGHPADPALAHGDLQVRAAAADSPTTATRRRPAATCWPNRVAPSCRTGAPGGISGMPELPTCSETTVSVSHDGVDDRVPVAHGPTRRAARSRGAARAGVTEVKPRAGVAPDLGRRRRGIGQVGDPERDDPVGVGAVPLLEEPVVPGPDAGQAEVAVPGAEEHPPAEAGDLGGEIDRRPDAVDVHVPHPGVDRRNSRAASDRSGRAPGCRSRAAGRPPRSCPPG